MPRPPVAPHLRLLFTLRFFCAQTLGVLGHLFFPHLPALPDRRQAGGKILRAVAVMPAAFIGKPCLGRLQPVQDVVRHLLKSGPDMPSQLYAPPQRHKALSRRGRQLP